MIASAGWFTVYTPIDEALNLNWIQAPNQSPHLSYIAELHQEAHHRVNNPNTGRNSGGRQIIKKSRDWLKL